MGKPFITVVPSKSPSTIFNILSSLIAAAQLDTRPARSGGRSALVILDNGRGATFVLATCDTNEEAEVQAGQLRAEMAKRDFDEWSQVHGIPSGFLDRPRDRGEIQKLIAGFWPRR
jgi:hypothetical protein